MFTFCSRHGLCTLQSTLYQWIRHRNLILLLARSKKITPEMISAGITALELYSESYPDGLLVETIYTAMFDVALDQGHVRQARSFRRRK
jgi:hypothetical protein